jgi:hypothetical protein
VPDAQGIGSGPDVVNGETRVGGLAGGGSSWADM